MQDLTPAVHRIILVLLALVAALGAGTFTQDAEIRVDPAKLTPAKATAAGWIDANSALVASLSDRIWSFAELSLKETKSAALLADELQRAGFRVARGVADMPPAFVAEYGSGKPVIGILAEFDALPGLSQQAVPAQRPAEPGAPGHGCGHNAFGAGSVGAALAVGQAIAAHGLGGTVRLYGTPAEENYSGKTYMARDGLFDDLDAALHWHPGSRTGVSMAGTTALNGIEIEFFGKTAHAGGAPWEGRSALDAVELTNIAMNYLREHVKTTARIHYVTTNGGAAPNIVPDYAKVWYMIRDQDRQGVEYLHERLLKCAEGAALQTETTFKVHILEGTWNMLVTEAGSLAMYANLLLMGPPRFTEQEQAFAKAIQKEMTLPEQGLTIAIDPLRRPGVFTGGGSSDVSDVSWITPTIGLGVALSPLGSPGHHWSMVACGGMSIGHKAAVVAAKTIAATALDLIQGPQLLQRITAEWKEMTRGIPYKSAIPMGQKPPHLQVQPQSSPASPPSPNSLPSAASAPTPDPRSSPASGSGPSAASPPPPQRGAAARPSPGILLEDLTWPEAEKALTPDTIVVIPIGAAAKEHGPHLRLKNDLVLAEYFKRRLVERVPVVVAPTVNYHFYPSFVEYPGSTTLRLETARDVLVDICRSLARFGPRRFYALNTGVSTIRALQPAADLLAADGIVFRFTDILRVGAAAEESVRQQEGGTHADEIETSMMLYMDPSLVDMSKAVKDYHPSGTGGLTRDPKGKGTYSPTGIWGDPTLATREKGRIVVEAMVEGMVAEVKALASAPVPGAPKASQAP